VVAQVGGGETVGGVGENSGRPVGEQGGAVGPWRGAQEKWHPQAVGTSMTPKILKYEMGTSMTPKISKLGMVVEYVKRNNVHFGKEIEFQINCELKNLGIETNLNLV
jgi:hypothetical protein